MVHLPPENQPEWTTYVQWKGTDLCMDFWCPKCGGHSHFDGMFAYHIQCTACDTIFRMPTNLPVEEVKPGEQVDCVLRGE